MRKRRILADKLTIIVCAVLVAVSAFFYAPMEVSAESMDSGEVIYSDNLENVVDVASIGSSYTGNSISGYYRSYYFNDEVFDFASYMNQGAGLYKVSFDISFTMTVSNPAYFYNTSVVMNFSDTDSFSQIMSNYSGSRVSSYTYSGRRTLYTTLDDTSMDVIYAGFAVWTTANGNPGTVTIGGNYSLSNISVEKVSATDSEDYQNGYNAGYSAGEQAGYGNGYSQGFTDGETSVDTDAIYDEAFQAGKYSVDTQSYYDAGYQAGYQVAYSEGYESGYDEGYQNAMDRIDGWGADSSDYPILKYSFFKDRLRLICDVFTSAPSTSYDSSLLCYLDFDINPNHTYKFSVNTGGASGGSSDALYSDFELNFVIGSNTINAHNNIGNTFDFYIPGFNMGSSILLEAFVYDCVYYGGPTEEDGFLKHMGQVYPTLIDCYIDIYDMGPSGDTQNHIANQTDKLTNGFNDSKGNSVNSDFSSGLNDFETAEDSLFATATTGLKDFTFFDFQSVPAMVTGMSFVGSIMSGWFTQAGGASGVGIVLSILFSIMLVAMVLGLYRWYQSKGGKD